MILPVVLSSILSVVVAAPSHPIVVADLPPGPQFVHAAPEVVHAAPAVVHAAPAVVHAAPVAVVSSQSHAQDELGQYSYSYSNPLSAKVETKTVDGVTRGGYSYLDSHGLVQNVNYVSDDVNGFRVAASNLPLGPVTPQEDEPLVAVEKAKAVAALQEAAVKDAAEAAVAYENEVASGPLPSAPVAPVVYETSISSTPAPPTYVSPAIAAAPEVHVTPAPVPVVSHSPVAPVVHITPAPHRLVSSGPSFDHSPAQLVIDPAPHSYATVELDSYDIPAPAPAPGAYFRPSAAVISHSPVLVTPIPAVPAAEPAAPAPSPIVPVASPTPVVYEAAPVIHATPAPAVVHPAPAVVHGAPVVHAAPAVVHASPVVAAAPVAVVSSQSHAQDELGQYSYSYSNPLSAKVETKTVDGVTRGGYSYLDSHGLVQNVNYVSDDVNGFRVAASNLPVATVPVEIPDSEDIAAAKQVFFAEIAKAKAAVAHAH